MSSRTRISIFLCSLLFALGYPFISPSLATALPPKPCIRVSPGQAIDDIRLGMTLKELQHLSKTRGLKMAPENPSYPHIQIIGMYRVIFAGYPVKKIRFIDVSIPKPLQACLRFGKQEIRPARTWLHVASQLGACGPVEHVTGGSTISCENKGMVLIKSRSPGFRITVSPSLPISTNKPHCDGYIQRGHAIFAHGHTLKAKQQQIARFSLKENKTYCINFFSLSIHSTPKDIPTMGECTTIHRRGGSIVYCNHSGVAFFFAGPSQKLHHIELYHQKHLPLSTQYPPPLK